MKVTIQSVADHAGVSIGTVSRVLNHDPSVSPDLLHRVKQSVKALDYSPLRKRKASSPETSGIAGRTIGLLTLGMDCSLSQLPVVTAAIDGIREQLQIEGANLQWIDAPNPGDSPELASANSSRCLDHQRSNAGRPHQSDSSRSPRTARNGNMRLVSWTAIRRTWTCRGS